MAADNRSIPTLKDLGLPPAVRYICTMERGLAIVAGEAGHGKSATLAAIVGHCNERRAGHIVIVEDGAEYRHEARKSRITRIEVGADAASCELALQRARALAPDVVVIDRIRDRGAVEQALELAKAGCLCIAAVRAPRALSAIDGLLDFFPDERRQDLLADIARNVTAIVSQRLVPTKDRDGVVPAVGILIGTPEIQALLADKEQWHRIDHINGVLEKGHLGMQTVEQHLAALYLCGSLDMRTALDAGDSMSEVRLWMKLNTPGLAFPPLWKDFVFEMLNHYRWNEESGPSPYKPRVALERFLDEAGETACGVLAHTLGISGDGATEHARAWACFGFRLLGPRGAAGLDRLEEFVRSSIDRRDAMAALEAVDPARARAVAATLDDTTSPAITISGLSLEDGTLVSYLTGTGKREEIKERHLEAAIVVSAAGRVDMGGELHQRMPGLIQLARRNAKSLIIDLSDWEYRDSGWDALLVAAMERKNGGITPAVVKPQWRAMRERFETSMIRFILPCYPSLESALAAYVPQKRASPPGA
jgi:Tfp pilus assembly ATPase PilU